MRKKRTIGVILLTALLCSTLFLNTDGVQALSHRIVWDGYNGTGEQAILMGNEWYVPADALEKAFGIQVRTTDNQLEMSSTDNLKSQWDYKPLHYRDEVITLMYHNIQKNPDNVTFISPNQLEEQIQALLHNNYHFISMDQYMNFMLHGAQIPPNAVMMTFDDGYESFYTEVYPIMQKYHIPATSFVIVSTIDNRKSAGRPKLTWEQMREMKRNGMSFYSHTFNSHAYTVVNENGSLRPMLSKPQYLKKLNRKETREEFRARVKQDLKQAEMRLKQMLGNTYSVVAFPYGAFNKDVLDVCKELGIYVTFTVKPGINQRSTTNGFRINAGNQKIRTSDLLERIGNKGKDAKLGRAKTSYTVRWNQEPIYSELTPVKRENTWYLQLAQLRQVFGIKYEIDDVQQVVRLFPGK